MFKPISCFHQIKCSLYFFIHCLFVSAVKLYTYSTHTHTHKPNLSPLEHNIHTKGCQHIFIFFMLHRRKSVIEVWKYMRVSKLIRT